MTTAYYNECAQYPAAWLRNLSDAGHIARGVVDERRIERVTAADVAGHTQAHFFAGIGVWSYALKLAGWRDEWSVWSGSPPCQPFSQAGRREGFDDERHLWPVFAEIIREIAPPVVFIEQVASADGRAWLDVVLADLEGMGFAVGATDLCAAGIGAPHIRQRIYVGAARLGHPDLPRLERGRTYHPDQRLLVAPGVAGLVANPDGVETGGDSERVPPRECESGEGRGETGRRAHSNEAGRVIVEARVHGEGEPGHDVAGCGKPRDVGAVSGFWADAEWAICRPESCGKPWTARPAQQSSQFVAAGTSANLERLRAAGNGLCAWAAATFILSFMEALEDMT